MLDYFYKSEYSVPTSASALTFHLNVFTETHKYGSSTLKVKTIQQFNKASGANRTTGELVEMVRRLEELADTMLSSTPRFQMLKDIAMAAVRLSLAELVKLTESAELLQDLPKWAVELFTFMDQE